jgi:uncharacterized protein YciI
MPFFALVCTDKPDSLDLRIATRPAHLDYLKTQAALLRGGGPIVDDDGRMKGSLLVLEAANRAAVEAFSQADPYRKAGLFGEVQAHRFNPTTGPWAP